MRQLCARSTSRPSRPPLLPFHPGPVYGPIGRPDAPHLSLKWPLISHAVWLYWKLSWRCACQKITQITDGKQPVPVWVPYRGQQASHIHDSGGNSPLASSGIIFPYPDALGFLQAISDPSSPCKWPLRDLYLYLLHYIHQCPWYPDASPTGSSVVTSFHSVGSPIRDCGALSLPKWCGWAGVKILAVA